MSCNKLSCAISSCRILYFRLKPPTIPTTGTSYHSIKERISSSSDKDEYLALKALNSDNALSSNASYSSCFFTISFVEVYVLSLFPVLTNTLIFVFSCSFLLSLTITSWRIICPAWHSLYFCPATVSSHSKQLCISEWESLAFSTTSESVYSEPKDSSSDATLWPAR